MFENNPYKIPSDKFEYVRKIMLELNITVRWQLCDSNPFLNICDCQEYRDLRVKHRRAKSRKISITSFEHYKLILRCRDTVRSIYLSIDTSDGQEDYVKTLIATHKALYTLVIHLWYLSDGWTHVLNDKLYLWSEANGSLDFFDSNYLHNRFEYDKNNLRILVKIFGKYTLKDIMDNLTICAQCRGVE